MASGGKKSFPSTMPSLVKSWTDTPASWNNDLRNLVQLSVSLARVDGEVASLVQLGIETRFGFAGRWCVAVGRGQIFYNARTRVGTRALLRVPCLGCELVDGLPPKAANYLSVLIFQAAGDAPPLMGAAGDAPVLGGGAGAGVENKSKTPAAPTPTISSMALESAVAATAATATHRSSLRPLLSPLPPSALLIPLASRSAAGSAHAASLIGGVVATVGLHAGVAEAAAAAVRGALRAEWGATWHVVIGGASAAVAPPAVRPGEWLEAVVTPSSAHAASLPHDPSIREKTPSTYRIIAFRTCPGHGEPPVRSQFYSALAAAAAEPLILIRAALYTLGFAAFIAFLGFSQGVDNTCSRLAGAGLVRMTSPVGVSSVRAFFGSLGVFSTSLARAAAALDYCGLDATADGGTAVSRFCSLEAVVSADVRIVRGRFLLVAAGSAAVFAAFVVRYMQYGFDLAKRSRAAVAIKAAVAIERARTTATDGKKMR